MEFLFDKLSYFGIVAFLALTGCGLPIPEEAPLVLAGVLSSNGTLAHPELAFAACLVGALLGDSVMYFIGRMLGHSFLTKHPSVARFVNIEEEEKFEQIVNRHGFKVLLLTRFLIGVRGPVYFAAGAAKVPYWRFFLWDLCAASIVVSLVFGLAYAYGESIESWIRNAEEVATVVVVLAVLIAGGIWLYRKHHQRLAKALAGLAADTESEVANEKSLAGEANADESSSENNTATQEPKPSANGSNGSASGPGASPGASAPKSLSAER